MPVYEYTSKTEPSNLCKDTVSMVTALETIIDRLTYEVTRVESTSSTLRYKIDKLRGSFPEKGMESPSNQINPNGLLEIFHSKLDRLSEINTHNENTLDILNSLV